jgi:hypothetical protein
MRIEQMLQSKKKTEELIEDFSREKAEDPLIKYWIERQREQKQMELVKPRQKTPKSSK